VSYPALEEVYDYFWCKQYDVCMEKMGPLTDESPLGTRFECVERESIVVKVGKYILWRPEIATNLKWKNQ
jgi:hypothetical protein